MLYALIDNNKIMVGPRTYRSSFFSDYLKTKDISYNLPLEYDNSSIISITDSISILPVEEPIIPSYDSLVEQLAGPFWTITDTKIIGEYKVVDRNHDAAQNDLKAKLSSFRYNKEIAGTTITIQGNEISLDTTRESRQKWIEIYTTLSILGKGSIITYKFTKEGIWLDLTISDVKSIISTIMGVVQDAYKWEKTHFELINDATEKSHLQTLHETIKPSNKL